MRNIILLGLLSFLPILTAAYASEFEHGSKLNHPPSKVSQKLMDKNMEALLEKYVKKTSAGVVAAIIDQENVKFFACGKKSVNGDGLVSDETIFEIGSITKVFTSSVLMDMVHKGQVHLDDPIDFYLTEVKIPQFENKKITFRHLATHTSGLPPLPDNFDQTNLSDPYQNYTTRELYDFLNHYELKKSPGEDCCYSNYRGIICHTGGTGGFGSFIGFNPKNQKGVVLLSNSADFFSDDLTLGLLDPENFTPEPPIDEALTNLAYLKQFEGVFETIPSTDQQISCCFIDCQCRAMRSR